MRILTAVVALLLALSVGSGFAQNSKLGNAPKKDGPTQNEINTKKAEEKAYKSAVDRVPDQKFDPWRNMR